ncbi:MAG: RNA chaperone Hfq [Clostridia bacterium]
MKQINLQDGFLNALRKSKATVTLVTTNGFQMKNAVVLSFDNYAVLLIFDGRETLVFKHAISSIIANNELNFMAEVKYDDAE